MYAVVRTDLGFSAGKSAAQAGHAFVNSFVAAPSSATTPYGDELETSKIVLTAPNHQTLLSILTRARAAGLPCAPVWEHADNAPQGLLLMTAIGIGPAPREQIKPITKGLDAM